MAVGVGFAGLLAQNAGITLMEAFALAIGIAILITNSSTPFIINWHINNSQHIRSTKHATAVNIPPSVIDFID